MAYEFQRINALEVLADVPKGATVLAEVNGDIKRVPSTGLSGGAGCYVVILTEDNFVDTDNGMQCTDNYDAMYDVLVAGGSVWIDFSELDGFFNRTIVMCCEISPVGLYIYYNGNELLFPNGSHNLPASEK